MLPQKEVRCALQLMHQASTTMVGTLHELVKIQPSVYCLTKRVGNISYFKKDSW